MSPRPAAAATLVILPLLAAAAFASGAGMRLLDPLLPLIAADFGVSVAATAALVGGFALTYGAGQVLVGPLGDRFGKLRVLTVALVLYGLGVMACALPGELGTLIALRALCGALGGALFPLALAWIGDTVPYAERQATIGRLLTGMVMAQLLAGPVAGAVGERFGWRAAFALLGALALAVGLLLVVRLGPVLRQPVAGRGGGGALGPARFLELLRRPGPRRLLAAAFIDGFCLFGGAFPFVGSFLIQDFGLTPSAAGLVVAGFGLGAFVYTRLARLLVRRLGERGLVLRGGLALVAVLAGLALAPHWGVVAACQAVAGLVFFMFHGVLQARATEALPEARATAVSAFAMALFLGQSLGSLAFGAVIAAGGYRAVFALAAAVLLGLTLWTRAMLTGTRAAAGG